MSKGQARTLIIVTIFLFTVGAIVNYVPIAMGGTTALDVLANITGLPKTDLFFPNFLWMFMVPLIGSTAMVMAVMNVVTGWMVTDKNLNLIIALSWMGVVFATPVGRGVIWFIMGSLGIWGVGIYAFIFVFGSYLLARRFAKNPFEFMTGLHSKNLSKLQADYFEASQKYMDAVAKKNTKEMAKQKALMEYLSPVIEAEKKRELEAAA